MIILIRRVFGQEPMVLSNSSISKGYPTLEKGMKHTHTLAEKP